MLKRSLVFTSPAALSLKNAQLVITLKEQPDACRTVPIEELGVVLVDSPMVSLTIPLINALADENVALIFWLWFDVEKRYNTTGQKDATIVSVLWFDVEKRYNTT